MAVQSSAQAVVQQVLAAHKASPAPAAPKLVVKPAAAAVVAPAATVSTASSEVKASQDKVKEMAQKLGVPFTNDLLSLDPTQPFQMLSSRRLLPPENPRHKSTQLWLLSEL